MLARRLTNAFAKWQTLIGIVFNPYRPELHYMRGPGPKWRAKHGATHSGWLSHRI